MKTTKTSLSIIALALLVSACSPAETTDESHAAASTPPPQTSALAESPAASPSPSPTPTEAAVESGPELVALDETFTLTGPDQDTLWTEEGDFNPDAPTSTWEFSITDRGVNETLSEQNPPCLTVWGTATLVETSEGTDDAAPPAVIAFIEGADGHTSENVACDSNGSGVPDDYAFDFSDTRRFSTGDTYNFSTTITPFDEVEEPRLTFVLSGGTDAVHLVVPAEW